jgi:hypothetical protein
MLYFVDVATKLVAELQACFPALTLMDAFGFVYPQYWMSEDTDQNFGQHLTIIKAHYGHTTEIKPLKGQKSNVSKPKKRRACMDGKANQEVASTTLEVAPTMATTTESLPLTPELFDPILLPAKLD